MRGSSSQSDSANRRRAASLGNFDQSFPCEQPYLFSDEAPVVPGSLNDESVVRGVVTEAIKGCAKSRDQIVEEMTRLLGDRVTVRMLNSYTSEAAEQHRWPAQYTRAFCHVVQDWTLLRCITERSGFRLITKSEAELLELGRQYLIRKQADEAIQKLERRLHGREL